MKLLCGKCQKQVEPNDMYVCYECGAYVCKDCMNAQSDMVSRLQRNNVQTLLKKREEAF